MVSSVLRAYWSLLILIPCGTTVITMRPQESQNSSPCHFQSSLSLSRSLTASWTHLECTTPMRHLRHDLNCRNPKIRHIASSWVISLYYSQHIELCNAVISIHSLFSSQLGFINSNQRNTMEWRHTPRCNHFFHKTGASGWFDVQEYRRASSDYFLPCPLSRRCKFSCSFSPIASESSSWLPI